jgi:hypothetical protein
VHPKRVVRGRARVEVACTSKDTMRNDMPVRVACHAGMGNDSQRSQQGAEVEKSVRVSTDREAWPPAAGLNAGSATGLGGGRAITDLNAGGFCTAAARASWVGALVVVATGRNAGRAAGLGGMFFLLLFQVADVILSRCPFFFIFSLGA